MYFNVNFNVFFKIKNCICWWVNTTPSFSFCQKIVLMVFIFFKQTLALYVHGVIYLGLLKKVLNFCVKLVLCIILTTALYT